MLVANKQKKNLPSRGSHQRECLLFLLFFGNRGVHHWKSFVVDFLLLSFFFLILFFSCFSPYTYLLLSPHFVFFAAATITSCGRHHSRAKIIIRSVSLLFWRTGSCLLFLLQWLSRWRTRCSVKDQREYLSKKQWENSLPKRWKKV